MRDDIDAVSQQLGQADHVVALTGAGVSTASGIPDFRSEGGIWDQYDPSEFHYSRFKADPAGFWEKRVELYDTVFADDIGPNAAHDALATLESKGLLDCLITQNIDGLHAEAGSESIIEIHGNGKRVVCESCGEKSPLEPVKERVEGGDLPPRCDCGGVYKPDVVLFGEQLPQIVLQQAQGHAHDADLFLAIGSSLSVRPASSLPRIATENGSTLVIVNLEQTGVSEAADFDFRADVTDVLPEIVQTVE